MLASEHYGKIVIPIPQMERKLRWGLNPLKTLLSLVFPPKFAAKSEFDLKHWWLDGARSMIDTEMIVPFPNLSDSAK
jgi:hypothetical protein